MSHSSSGVGVIIAPDPPARCPDNLSRHHLLSALASIGYETTSIKELRQRPKCRNDRSKRYNRQFLSAFEDSLTEPLVNFHPTLPVVISSRDFSWNVSEEL